MKQTMVTVPLVQQLTSTYSKNRHGLWWGDQWLTDCTCHHREVIKSCRIEPTHSKTNKSLAWGHSLSGHHHPINGGLDWRTLWCVCVCMGEGGCVATAHLYGQLQCVPSSPFDVILTSSNSLTHCNECIQWTVTSTNRKELTQISGDVPVPSTIDPEEHSISEHCRAACFVHTGSHKGLATNR